MGYAKHIGRVGALAVALGVGVAVTTTPLAGAQPSDSGSSSSSSSPGRSATTDSSASTNSPSGEGSTSPGTTPGGSAVSDESDAADTSDARPGSASAASRTTPADDDSDGDEAADEPGDEEQEPAPAAVGGDAPRTGRDQPDNATGKVRVHDDATAQPGRTAIDRGTSTSPAAGVAVERTVAPRDTAGEAEAPRTTARSQLSRSDTRETVTLSTTALAAAPASLEAANTVNSAAGTSFPRPAPAPTDVVGMATQFVAAMLAPLFQHGPQAPGLSPLLWAVFGWMRREFERMFNHAPDIKSQKIIVELEDPTAISDPISFKAKDIDGDTLTYKVPERGTPFGPQHGTVTIDQATGTFTYDPDDDFARTGGIEHFAVTVSDKQSESHHPRGLLSLLSFLGFGSRHTDTAIIVIKVKPTKPTNGAPVARDDAVETDEDRPVAITPLGNDTDPDGDPLRVLRVTQPATANGTAVLSADGTTITYTPNADFFGTDSLTYTISDGHTESQATVTVTVNPVDDPPTAVADAATTNEDTPITLNVLTNDTDVDGGPMKIVAVDAIPATTGTLAFTDNTLTYTPAADFTGTATFGYTLNGGSTATVTVTVNPVNDPPVKVGDGYTILADNNDGKVTGKIDVSDVDDVSHTYELKTNPAFGEVTVVEATGEFTFTYTEADRLRAGATTTTDDDSVSFTVTVSDDEGGTEEVTVTISITPKKVSLTTNVMVGDQPFGVAVADLPDGRRFIYVANNESSAGGSSKGTVSVINAATNAVIRTISVVGGPMGVAVSPNGEFVYVTREDQDAVTVIRTADNLVIDSITAVGDRPVGAVVLPDGRIYVTNNGSGTVSVIDPNTNSVIDVIRVGTAPRGITASPDGSLVYVANEDSDSVSVITTIDNTVTTINGVGDRPVGVGVMPDGTRVYVANNPLTGSSREPMSVIDTTNGNSITRFDVGTRQNSGVVFSPDGSVAYVPGTDNTLLVIATDTNTVIDRISVGTSPVRLAISSDGNTIYVANNGVAGSAVRDTVSVLTVADVDVDDSAAAD